MTGFAPGELDLLVATPPCAGHSRAGRRAVGDPRNALWLEVVRLLALLPAAFIIEAVPGLTQGRIRPLYQPMIDTLQNSGYRVRAWILNFQHYQVPQSRRRIIVIGVREDLSVTPTAPRRWPPRSLSPRL
jgi:DNA (cytosine-5)-methyltransferase 1